MPTSFEMRVISSLEKVFADERLKARPLKRASALAGEVYSFQVAIRCDVGRLAIKAEAISPLQDHITVRRVGLVPVELPVWREDDNYLRRTPGLYPDPLIESEPPFRPMAGAWYAYWVTIRLPQDHPAGSVPVRVQFQTQDLENPSASPETWTSPALDLRVIPARLPTQTLVNTHWFHTDCLSTHYRCKVWSRRHWQLLATYFRNATAHGQNALLTPLFTPPLDTRVGGERPTVQLVDVTYEDSRYSFDLTRLDQWIDLALKSGFEYLEMSHLFSQWGAKYAPKIMVKEAGRLVQKFGWHTPGDGRPYKAFLKAFLPVLTRHLKARGLADRCLFHISDEPSKKMIDTFSSAAAIVKPLLKGFKIIDALSDIAFYETGLIQTPIPSNDHIEPFVQARVPELWTYYCCAQMTEVSNRFIAMPSARNRILGVQLYVYDVRGFLHWGYNFWYTQYSTHPIDPWRVTDAGRAFQGGDPFVVYPGEDGPVDSLRHEVFFEALQDQRALQLLESHIGRPAVLKLIHARAGQVTMKSYPRDAAWLLSFREEVNTLIAQHHQVAPGRTQSADTMA